MTPLLLMLAVGAEPADTLRPPVRDTLKAPFPPRELPADTLKAPPRVPPEYAAARAEVLDGRAVVLVVGESTPWPAEYTFRRRIPSFEAVPDGVYDCWLENGVPVMRRRPGPPVQFAPFPLVTVPPGGT